jgi:hypothetical protein
MHRRGKQGSQLWEVGSATPFDEHVHAKPLRSDTGSRASATIRRRLAATVAFVKHPTQAMRDCHDNACLGPG